MLAGTRITMHSPKTTDFLAILRHRSLRVYKNTAISRHASGISTLKAAIPAKASIYFSRNIAHSTIIKVELKSASLSASGVATSPGIIVSPVDIAAADAVIARTLFLFSSRVSIVLAYVCGDEKCSASTVAETTPIAIIITTAIALFNPTFITCYPHMFTAQAHTLSLPALQFPQFPF